MIKAKVFFIILRIIYFIEGILLVFSERQQIPQTLHDTLKRRGGNLNDTPQNPDADGVKKSPLE